MSLAAIAERYFTFEERLASFTKPQDGTLKGGRSIQWPHRTLLPDDFAKAGFFFRPTPSSPDNVMCFLCHKNMDGWAASDNPWMEHLSHTRGECAWAVCSAILAKVLDDVVQQYTGSDDPKSTQLVQARKATFAGRWPHEGRKGWKCKTKQLAEAGWIYTPSAAADDEATCNYCGLALNGWEQGDKPLDEHRNRSPDCLFFTYTPQAAGKMPAKTRGQRTSKASRMSSQSVSVTAEPLVDLPAELEDSVMTTASSLTQGGRKAPRAKKTTAAAKGRKTRAKKDDAVEVYDAESEAVVADEMPPAPKSTRGRKRKSDEVEDSVVTLTEAPAPKKRGRGAANNVESSVLQPDVEMAEAKPVKRTNSRKKGTKATRRTSATSTASVQIPVTVAAPVETLDDDELQQQLEADFDRPFSDIEDLAADSDSERFRRSNSSVSGQKKPATSTAKKHQSKGSVSNFAMFDPTPVMPDEAAVEAEFEALKAKVASEEADTIDVPKKGRKAGVRKVSKQKAKAQAEPEPEPEPAPMEPPQEVPQPAEELSRHVRIQEPAAEMALPSVETATEAPTKRGRGRPKKFNASNTSSVSIEGGTMASASRESLEELPPRSQPTVEPPAVQKETSRTVISRKPLAAPQPTASQERSQQAHPGTPLRTSRGRTSASQPEPAPDTASRPTPATSNAAAARAIVATPSARQAQLSPSQSPQASDAENQPPSSRADLSQSSIGAGTVLEAKRVVLAPAGAVTPVRNNAGLGGYANNNVVGGLRSTEPWTAVDLDLFLESCGDVDKENATAGTLEAFSNLTKGAVLTSPERRMTVEEWILYNAGLAERRLRMECEAVVSAFEREGGRAMRALEGVIVE